MKATKLILVLFLHVLVSSGSFLSSGKKQLQIKLLQHSCTFDPSSHHKYMLHDSSVADINPYYLVGATDYYRTVLLDSLTEQGSRSELDSKWKCVNPDDLPTSPLTIREMDVYYAQDIMRITVGAENESIVFKDQDNNFVKAAHPLLDVLPMKASHQGITIQLQAFCFEDGAFGVAILSSNQSFPFENSEFLQELNATFLANSEGALMFTVEDCSGRFAGLDGYDWLVIGLVILFALLVIILHVAFLLMKVFRVVDVTVPVFEKQVYTPRSD